MSFRGSNKTLRTPPTINQEQHLPTNSVHIENTDAPVEGEGDNTCSTCPVCDSINTGDKMVACDACNQWYHFKCVGETSTVENHEWYCIKCGETTMNKGQDKNGDASSKKSSKRSSCSSKRARQLLLQKLEEERSLKEQRDKEERERKDKRDEEYLKKKYAILEDLTTDESDDDGKASEARACSVENWLKKVDFGFKPQQSESTFVKHLDIPHSSFIPNNDVTSSNLLKKSSQFNMNDNHPESFKPRGNKYTGTKPKEYALPAFTNMSEPKLKKTITLPSMIDKYNKRASIIETQVKSHEDISKPNASQTWLGAYHSNKIPIVKKLIPLEEYNQPISHAALLNPGTSAKVHQEQILDNTFDVTTENKINTSLLNNRSLIGFDDDKIGIIGPSKLQLTARQVTPRDLPNFNGRPEEWPLFISSYEAAQRVCGFTNDENLIRLQRCLKGQALEAVRSRLLLPENVPSIMATLKMLYGRPALIIETLLQKIRSEAGPKAEKLESIISYALSVQNLCATMEASGLITYLQNPSLLKELVDKLPPQMRLNWALYKANIENVTLISFSNWMYEIAEAANEVVLFQGYEPKRNDSKNEKKSTKRNEFVNTHIQDPNGKSLNSERSADESEQQTSKRCCICEETCKRVSECSKFINSTYQDKWQLLKKHHLCRKCLGKHSNKKCKRQKVCNVNGCTFKHHYLLHKNVEKPNVEKPNDETITLSSNVNTHQSHGTSIVFRIVPVQLHGPNKSINTYAFLDDGSSVTLIDQDIADELHLEGHTRPLCLKWTSNTIRKEENSRTVKCEISNENNMKRYTITNVRTVQSLNLPDQSVLANDLKMNFPHLRGLPISSYEHAMPKILIGLDNWHIGVPLRIREGAIGEVIATKTRLGWVLCGPCNNEIAPKRKFEHFHTCECQSTADENLDVMMKDHFLIENMGVVTPKNPISSNDDQRAIKILNDTTKRVGNRFQVGLLWKNDDDDLPNSYFMAKKRLQCLEKTFEKDPNLKENMKAKIESYLSKGFISKLNGDEIKQQQFRTWYLPVFAVKNPNKPNKIRMVWDAAAKVDNTSLNQMLLKGPDQLSSLIGILMRFREGRVAICGDIQEMFHQVLIQPSDQHSQRFLWRDEPSKPIDVYVMKVMTFGAACSPSSAQHVMKLNAQNFKSTHPKAVRSIEQNHYVDDLMESVSSEKEAIKLAQDVAMIHKHGGFHIRNWLSNCENVRKALISMEETESKDMSFGGSNMEKVLGLWWCTSTDTFVFKFDTSQYPLIEIPTKRVLLRVLMKVFDPLGLVGHILVQLKILIQETWRRPIGWDDKIDDDLYGKWKRWLTILKQLEEVRIPRWYAYGVGDICDSDNRAEYQLHTFVDASELAFACVAYLRISYGTKVTCALVGSKTRVSPLKSVSIPRLELQAAVLGTRFAQVIKSSLSITLKSWHFWTDSKTVLSWLHSEERKYKQYVAFRVGEIIENTHLRDWHWIPSKENVADDATRWGKDTDFTATSRWFCGPEILLQNEIVWPKQSFDVITMEEVKSSNHHLVVERKFHHSLVDVSRFVSWKEILRTQAYVQRFIYNSHGDGRRNIKGRQIGLITKEELKTAEQHLYREAQAECFQDEIGVLLHNKRYPNQAKNINRKSPLIQLSPYLDDNDVLRVGGRLSQAILINEFAKHPVILPKNHGITKLIVMEYHMKYHHLNNETVVNELRQMYSIARLRVVVNSVVRSCQFCRIRRATPGYPRMADLPPARLAKFTRPFTFVGVDYFGPMDVAIGRRREKRWGLLLTCLTIRAIHIEIAHSMSTDSCIMCMRNFMARRGVPLRIFSDNGTNFHGTNNELKSVWQNIDKNKLASEFTNSNMEWTFNPPSAPHMGGSWERLVQSVKKVLHQIKPSRTPSDELLRNLLTEIEATVNARPLTYIPVNHNEEAITPNHFLLGSSSGLKPVGEFTSEGTVLKKNWMIAQQLSNAFWRRWVYEYMPTLTRRSKWFFNVKPIEVNDIVVIVDNNNPRNVWPKGVVTETKIGKDGQVRQATVKTSSGTYTRPAVKLAVLDVSGTLEGRLTDNVNIPGGSVNEQTNI